MSALDEEIEAAEARVAMLKRRLAAAPCAEVGCDMQSYGGCNAGCGDDCNCSVPVNMCTKCGDCDYGNNSEAADIRRRCAQRSA